MRVVSGQLVVVSLRVGGWSLARPGASPSNPGKPPPSPTGDKGRRQLGHDAKPIQSQKSASVLALVAF